MAHHAVVESGQQLGNGCIEIIDVIKYAVTQDRQDPTLCHQHRRLNFSLVARLSDTCWYDSGSVIRGQLSVGLVQLRLIPVRMCHSGEKVVADRQRADAAKELVHPHVAVEPDRQLLRESGDREGVGTRPQGAYKQLRWNNLAGVRVDQRDAVAEVDKHLLPGAMRLAQRRVHVRDRRICEE